MNKKLLVLTMFLLIIPFVAAEEQLAFDGFESNSYTGGLGWIDDWTRVGTTEISFNPVYQGTYSARLQVQGTYIERSVDVTNYNDVTINFAKYMIRSSGSFKPIIIINNQEYILDEFDTHNPSWNTHSYNLPATPNDGIITVKFLVDGIIDLYLDNIEVRGTPKPAQSVTISTQNNYVAGSTIPIYLSSTETNQLHTLTLKNGATTICEQTTNSPSVANTMFEVSCQLPNEQIADVEATLVVTNNPSINFTRYFNILQLTGDSNKLNIDQVYFSPQVLQGGSTELFAVVDKTIDVNLSKLYVVVTFPDETIRRLSMEPTINDNEYRAFITDTYRVGVTNFTIHAESTLYQASYSNAYNVLPFSVEYVANVGSVSVIDRPTMDVYGTKYKPEDNGRTFIQLLDGFSEPLENKDCFTSIYYPDNTPFRYKQAMNYVDEGLYHYDFKVPYPNGVYMVSSYCIIDGTVPVLKNVFDGFESGTGTGGTNWSSDWTLNGATISTTNPFEGTYNLYLPNNNQPSRQILGNDSFKSVQVSFAYRAIDLKNNNYYNFELVDASGTIHSLLSITRGQDDALWKAFSVTLHDTVVDFNGTLTFRIRATGGTSGNIMYVDNVRLNFIGDTSELLSEYQVVRGSGEVHVSGDTLFHAEIKRGELINNENKFYLYYDVFGMAQSDGTNIDVQLNHFIPFACPHIEGAEYYDVDTDTWVEINTDIYKDFTQEGCVINFRLNMDKEEVREVRLVSDNYWQQVINSDYTDLKLMNDYINTTCLNYYTMNNLTPISLSQPVAHPNDNFYKQCYDFAFFYDSYNTRAQTLFDLTTGTHNFTIEEMFEFENLFIHLDDKAVVASRIGNSILLGLVNGGMYGLAILENPTGTTLPPYFNYYASISSPTLNYQATVQVPHNVWDYENRTLTYYPEFNYTLMAEAVWNFAGVISTVITDTFSGSIWNFNNRNLTYYEDVTDYNLIGETVWQFSTRNLTYYPEFSNLTAEDVWDYVNRSLTYYEVNNITVEDIWNYTERELTFYPNPNNLTVEDIWNYINRTLTFYEVSNLTVESIWSHTNRTLTLYEVNNISPQEIWEYMNRTLTFYDVNNITVEDIWNYVERELTFYPDVSNLTAQEVWEYVDRSLTYYDVNNITVEDIWNYTQRELTYYEDTTNYTQIFAGVWDYSDRELTFYPEVSNLTAQDVWDYVNRSLTYYEINNISVEDIWNFAQRELTFYPDPNNLTAQEVWEYVNRSLTYYEVNNITVEDIWSYVNRELTFYPTVSNLTAQDVWEYTNRNLTHYEDVTDYSQIFEGVWSYTTRNLTYYDDVTDYNNIAVNVWTFATRNLTYYPEFSNLTASDVWDYTDRNLTYFPEQLDLTDYNLINEGVWAYNVRNLTYYEDTTNYTLIEENVPTAVWTYVTRDLTFYPEVSNLTAQDVWDYVNRSLTYYEVNNITAEDIWSYVERELTLYPDPNNLTAQEVWEYVNRSLTYYDVNNITVEDIWSYVERELTYYEDTTNYTQIIEGVWDYVDRQLTFYPPAFVNTTEVAIAVWDYTNRNLTYFPEQLDLTDYSQIFAGVWSFTDRNLTFYPETNNLTAQDIWDYVDRTLTYYEVNNITAEDIWSYVERELTLYPEPNNLTSQEIWEYVNRSLTYYEVNNITVEDIWNYVDRNLTYYEDVTNYTQIIEGVWMFSNRNLTYFPQQLDLTDYAQIAFDVWNFTDRELTYYEVNNISAQDVWDYVDRTLTYYEVNNITAEDIWMFNNRTLTFIPEPNVNYTLIGDIVWDYSGRYTHGIIN